MDVQLDIDDYRDTHLRALAGNYSLMRPLPSEAPKAPAVSDPQPPTAPSTIQLQIDVPDSSPIRVKSSQQQQSQQQSRHDPERGRTLAKPKHPPRKKSADGASKQAAFSDHTKASEVGKANTAAAAEDGGPVGQGSVSAVLGSPNSLSIMFKRDGDGTTMTVRDSDATSSRGGGGGRSGGAGTGARDRLESRSQFQQQPPLSPHRDGGSRGSGASSRRSSRSAGSAGSGSGSSGRNTATAPSNTTTTAIDPTSDMHAALSGRGRHHHKHQQQQQPSADGNSLPAKPRKPLYSSVEAEYEAFLDKMSSGLKIETSEGKARRLRDMLKESQQKIDAISRVTTQPDAPPLISSSLPQRQQHQHEEEGGGGGDSGDTGGQGGQGKDWFVSDQHRRKAGEEGAVVGEDRENGNTSRNSGTVGDLSAGLDAGSSRVLQAAAAAVAQWSDKAAAAGFEDGAADNALNVERSSTHQAQLSSMNHTDSTPGTVATATATTAADVDYISDDSDSDSSDSSGDSEDDGSDDEEEEEEEEDDGLTMQQRYEALMALKQQRKELKQQQQLHHQQQMLQQEQQVLQQEQQPQQQPQATGPRLVETNPFTKEGDDDEDEEDDENEENEKQRYHHQHEVGFGENPMQHAPPLQQQRHEVGFGENPMQHAPPLQQQRHGQKEYQEYYIQPRAYSQLAPADQFVPAAATATASASAANPTAPAAQHATPIGGGALGVHAVPYRNTPTTSSRSGKTASSLTPERANGVAASTNGTGGGHISAGRSAAAAVLRRRRGKQQQPPQQQQPQQQRPQQNEHPQHKQVGGGFGGMLRLGSAGQSDGDMPHSQGNLNHASNGDYTHHAAPSDPQSQSNSTLDQDPNPLSSTGEDIYRQIRLPVAAPDAPPTPSLSQQQALLRQEQELSQREAVSAAAAAEERRRMREAEAAMVRQMQVNEEKSKQSGHEAHGSTQTHAATAPVIPSKPFSREGEARQRRRRTQTHAATAPVIPSNPISRGG